MRLDNKFQFFILVFVVLVTGAGFLSLPGLQSRSEETQVQTPAGEPRILPVATISAKRADSFEDRRFYSGILKAKREADLSFQSGGRLERVKVKTGERVEKGALLAELENAKTQSGKLVAPFDGVIARIQAAEGTTVGPGVPVLKMLQTDELEAWIGLPADVDVATSPDAEAAYTLHAAGNSYEAPIASLSPEVDPRSRTRMAAFTLDEAASQKLLPGEAVQLELPRETGEPGFWLPLTALTREIRGLWSVFVVEPDEEGNGRIARRYLEVLHLDGERAWVRGTLEDGDRVVATGTQRVVPGQRVEAKDINGAL